MMLRHHEKDSMAEVNYNSMNILNMVKVKATTSRKVAKSQPFSRKVLPPLPVDDGIICSPPAKTTPVLNTEEHYVC